MCKAYKVKGQNIRYHKHGDARRIMATADALREATR